MLERFLHLPLARKAALTTATLAAAACIVVVLACYQGSKQLVHDSATLFGESLIQQLAREASNPLVQGDKLSLQALLSELVNSPIVTHGVIYDVENQPITEAGQQDEGLSLSASITFQDSIAGYAVITLNSQSLESEAGSLAWQLMALSALLIILVYLLSALPARYVSALLDDLKVIASKGRSQSKLRITYQGKDELQQLAQQILHGPTSQTSSAHTDAEHAVLSLEVTNLAQLRQTMSRHGVRELIAECYKQLTVICKLYDGHITLRGADHFTVQFFPADDENNYPFRALCAGFLIQQWMASNHSPVSFDAGVSLRENSNGSELENEITLQEAIDEAMQAGRNGKGNLVATGAIIVHPSVNQRVNTEVLEHSEDGSLRAVKSLSDPYDKLLIRQLSTLSTQVTH
jgi:uncharacterized membrane protein affecting hemolysin expression